MWYQFVAHVHSSFPLVFVTSHSSGSTLPRLVGTVAEPKQRAKSSGLSGHCEKKICEVVASKCWSFNSGHVDVCLSSCPVASGEIWPKWPGESQPELFAFAKHCFVGPMTPAGSKSEGISWNCRAKTCGKNGGANGLLKHGSQRFLSQRTALRAFANRTKLRKEEIRFVGSATFKTSLKVKQ